ncbi:MAG: futalosine hydrolase [Bacteroidales bacterium]|nr:futalosine hydrolase [Bacteroidales bacterium]
MKILIVSATLFEVKNLVERWTPVVVIPNRLYHFNGKGLQVDILATGIGMVPAAFHIGKRIAGNRYDLAINAGICGSYHPDIALGSVFHVIEERLPEAGVVEKGVLRNLFDLGLVSPDEDPYEDGRLINRSIPEIKTIDRLKKVTGNTVNTLQTDPVQIKRLLAHSPADVESMEGAAFLFACLNEKIPSAQIRAVSNYVGELDKRKWEIRLAVRNLDETLMEILGEMRNKE